MSSFCWRCTAPMGEGQTVCPSCGHDCASHSTLPHQLLPGTLLAGRYAIGAVLGEGGFGITYVGLDTRLGRKIAVKEFYMRGFVSRFHTHSPEVQVTVGDEERIFSKNRDRFLDEARVLASFSDEEGIVGVHDYFLENNTAYIVMAFLSGETLKDRLQRCGCLSWDETYRIMRPVLTSLAEVHRHGVIHRDISPDNLMLTDRGQVKLLDFGAAREFSQQDPRSMSIILKPGYAPYEQYQTRGVQGPWTDIYALCATMYRCLTGMIPEDSMDRLEADHTQPPAAICDCPAHVSQALMVGLSVRRQDRFQSIEELLHALENAEPASAPVQPPVQQWDPDATVYAGAASTAARTQTPPQPTAQPSVSYTVQPTGQPSIPYAAPITGQPSATYSAPSAQPYDPDATVYAGAAAPPQTPPQPMAQPSAPYAAQPPVQRPAPNATAFSDSAAAMTAIQSSRQTPPQPQGQWQAQPPARPKKKSAARWLVPVLLLILLGCGFVAVSAWGLPDLGFGAGKVEPTNALAVGVVEYAEEGETEWIKDVAKWGQVEAIAAGNNHAVGLKADGTVVSAGSNWYGQRSGLSEWTEITAIDASVETTLGLRRDGTVMAAGFNDKGQCDVTEWTDIVAVAAGEEHSVGLRSDGTVVAVGNNKNGQCDVSGWSDIVAIAAGNQLTVGLRSDGTVVLAGSLFLPYAADQSGVDNWTDIVAISAGYDHVVGLRSDGSVVAAGNFTNGEGSVTKWKDVVAISCGRFHTMAIRSDGTVLVTGSNDHGQCSVEDWSGLKAVAGGGTISIGLQGETPERPTRPG